LNAARIAHYAAVASLTALIALSVAWELWLAPLRPGGSWMVLKAVPLLAPLFGILHGRTYTFRWATLLMVVYFVEGCMRAYAEHGLAAGLAAAEVALSLMFIVAAVVYVRSRALPASGERSRR
jgi:uncharacterized membrane protein